MEAKSSAQNSSIDQDLAAAAWTELIGAVSGAECFVAVALVSDDSPRGVAAAFLMMLLGEGFEGLTAAAAGVEALAGVLLFFDFFSPGVDAGATGAGEDGGAAF